MTDLARLRNDLVTIADCYAAIAVQHRTEAVDQRLKPGHHRMHRDGKGGPLVHGQPDGTTVAADPVASTMPSGPTKQASTAPRVGGSHEAPVPVSLDLIDITAPANADSLLVADLSPWPEDQIGDPAIASELHFWVHDIAAMMGEREPLPTVPAMAMWLHERAGWAWDYYGALDEMAVKVGEIARRLHAIVNPRAPRPERKAAPCPGCGEASLLGERERVWCEDEACGRVLTEGEYAVWAASEAHRELNGGVGISAKAIAIRWSRNIGTVKRWAHQYGWDRSSGSERPVLYLTEQVEKTMVLILAREERERREQEAKAA